MWIALIAMAFALIMLVLVPLGVMAGLTFAVLCARPNALPSSEGGVFLGSSGVTDGASEVTLSLAHRERAPAPSAGDRVDRYILLEELGTGGMGVVFLAYDPKLDRKVALKLLRFRGNAESNGAQRMIREAQALAKLAHPNVVVVHEVGEADDSVFIAMEHVGGDTLLRWMARPHDWRQIVHVFLAAGRGLAAAHGAGLVHRDFKPANVLMGEGAARPRVVDFGLARPPTPSMESAAAPLVHAPIDPSTLTETGLVVGTPRYMAPEQHAGAPGDAASDQFAFCVALFEALYQQRPHAGETAAELLIAKRRRELQVPPRRRVPARVHTLVLRGLSPHPAERFASMNDLLARLERAAAPRRTGVMVAGVVLAAGAATWWALSPTDEPCRGGLERVDAVWSDAARAVVADAFARSSPALGPPTTARVQPVLDAYAANFGVAHRSACEATIVHREQSAALMDQRVQCLDGRLREFRALVTAFTAADASTVHGAATAAAGLPLLAQCADPAFVGAQVRPPQDAAVAAEVERLRDALADARALGHTGHFEPARQAVDALSTAVVAVDYAPLAVEHALARASLASQAGEYAPAEAELREVLVDAHRLGAAHLASAASLVLIDVLAKLDRTDEALWLARLAEADAERDEDPRRQSAVLLERGTMLSFRGRHEDALVALSRVLTLRKESDAPALDIGAAHNSLATVCYRAGDVERAITEQQTALAIAREVMGPRHPHVAASLSNLSVFRRDVGELDAALADIEEALSISREILGARHPTTAAYLDNLSSVLGATGRHAEALTALDEALAIRLSRLDNKSEQVAKTYNNLAVVQFELGRTDEAVANLRHALKLRTETLGDSHPETIKALSNLGGVLAEAGHAEEAEPLLERALAARIELLGADHPHVLVTRLNLAQLRLDQGRIEDAHAIVELVAQIAARVLPERHVDWSTIWRTQGRIASAQGRVQDAIDAHERELASLAGSKRAQEIEQARERLDAARAKL